MTSDFIWKCIFDMMDIILFIIMEKILFKYNTRGNKNKYMIIGILYLLDNIMNFLIGKHFLSIVPWIAVFLLYEGNIIKKLLVTICIQLVIFLIQEITILIIGLNMNSVFHNMNEMEFICIIAVSIAEMIFYYGRKRLEEKIELSDITSYLCLNINLELFSALIPLIIVNYLQDELPYRVKIVIIITSYAIIILSLLTAYKFSKNYNDKIILKQKNEEKNKILELQKTLYDKTVKDYENLNRLKHDIKGYLRVLDQLKVDNKNYAECTSSLQNVVENLQKYQCDNVYVSAVVNSIARDCESFGIELKMEYSVNGNILMDPLHLCSLLNNLLYNALEAEQKSDKTNKMISLSIYNIDNHVMIQIENDVISFIDSIDHMKNNISSKKDKQNHGIGLKNVQMIVDTYFGDFKIYEKQDERIHIEIFLQDVVE